MRARRSPDDYYPNSKTGDRFTTKTIALALALTLECTAFALAKDDDDDKISDADMAKVTAALADLGCKDKHEQEGIYEIDDAECKMGTGISRISPSSSSRATNSADTSGCCLRQDT